MLGVLGKLGIGGIGRAAAIIGTGMVEAYCSSCNVLLTTKNVGGEYGFGYEGDDCCKKCEAIDEAWAKKQAKESE